jgi:hypothetical protein
MFHFIRSLRRGSVAVIATLTLALALIAGLAPENAAASVIRNLGG